MVECILNWVARGANLQGVQRYGYVMYVFIWRGKLKVPSHPPPPPPRWLCCPSKMTLSVINCSCRVWECMLLKQWGVNLMWLQGLVPQTVDIKDFKVGTSGRDFSLQLKSV